MSAPLAQAMFIVLASWAVLVGAFMGLGLEVQRHCGLRPSGAFSPAPPPLAADRLLAAFWMGFAVVILILQLWNLVLPITWRTQVVLLALGLLGLGVNARGLTASLGHALRHQRVLCLAVILLAVWLADRAIGPGDAHDSGLYHYAVMRWANTYPVVPGLGNLCGPYALNNSSLLYDAMLNTGPLAGVGRGNHLANGLLLLMLGVQVVRAAFGLFSPEPSRRLWHVADVLLLPLVVMLALAKDVSSPKTDLPVGALMIVVGSWLLRWFTQPAEPDGADPADAARQRACQVIFIGTLAAAAVCIKLSAAVFALAAWVLVVGVWLLRERPAARAHGIGAARILGWTVALSALLIGPWLARGGVMSGYPFFPNMAIKLPVDWRVPEPVARDLDIVIRNHVKGELPLWLYPKMKEAGVGWYADLMKPPFDDRQDINGWEWLRPWLFTLPVSSAIEVVMPMGLVALVCIAGLWRRFFAPAGPVQVSDSAPSHSPWWALVPAALGLVFWFFVAPGPRYAWPFMWLLAGQFTALVLAPIWMAHAPSPSGRRHLGLLLAGALLLTIPVFVYQALRVKIIFHTNPLAEVPFLRPGPDRGFHPIPTRELEITTTRWGLAVYTPKGEGEIVCWDAPLPSVAWPPLDLNLRLRKEGDLRSGFRIDPGPTR